MLEKLADGVSAKKRDRAMQPGDIVEVRSPAEIFATLDEDGALDAMPFMPELIKYTGKRFTVSRRVEKICDTVSGGPPGSRRMHDTVLLDDLRCDGSGHGGCQAGCRIYWKEAWLRRVYPDGERATRVGDGQAQLEEVTQTATRVVREVDGTPTESYRCQATEALRATEPLSNFDPRQYGRELNARNVGPLRLFRVALRALGGLIGRRLHLVDWVPVRNRGVQVRTKPSHTLEAGDWVEVKSPDEIKPTVNDKGFTRGLSFDEEMVPYCGGRYRVQKRVERIIDERNGQMIEIPSDCLILDGVVCSGEHSIGRWLCPRAIYPYWRESWLRPVDAPADPEQRDDDSAHDEPR